MLRLALQRQKASIVFLYYGLHFSVLARSECNEANVFRVTPFVLALEGCMSSALPLVGLESTVSNPLALVSLRLHSIERSVCQVHSICSRCSGALWFLLEGCVLGCMSSAFHYNHTSRASQCNQSELD